MRNVLLFILITTVGFPQQMPVAESNAFIYNNYNYGYDFLNVVHPFSMDKNGAVWFQPYNKEILKINNSYTTLPFDFNGKSFGDLEKVFQIHGCEYYCTSRNILVVKNNKLIRQINLNALKVGSGNFTLFENKIYFLKSKTTSAQPLQLLVFDGIKINVLKNFSNEILSAINYLHLSNHYFVESTNQKTTFYEIKNKGLLPLKTFPFRNQIHQILNFKNLSDFTFLDQQKRKCIWVKKGKIDHVTDMSYFINKDSIVSNVLENQKYIYQFKNDAFIPVANSSTGDTFMSKLFSPESNSYYCGTSTSLLRLFPHIKKYPRLFYNSNSNSVFTLQQDYKGQIWAGSYQMALSVITNDKKVIQNKKNNIRFLNGGTNYKDKIVLLAESNGGVLLYDDMAHFRKIADSVSGFFTYISKNNKLYLGTSMKGLWFTNTASLENDKKINWTKISEKQGLDLENILTVAEDQYGNIWYGSGRGIGTYNTTTQKCKTWKLDDLKMEFLGTRAILSDNYNTLWIGARNGELLFYNGKNPKDYSIKDLVTIKHPLLENGKAITFIHQWSNYLILGAQDKILLFDLKKWHENKTVAVRYLNPMEINLTNSTEQNTILTDKRDQSIWMASSDMVYQWDIKKWLDLPVFNASPSIIIKKDSLQTEITSHKCIEFKPTENSFDIQINYQTKDNMPRFLNGTLVKKGEKPQFEHPNLQTKFQFKNLSPGDYIFYIRICQQDGRFDVFEYPIKINNFFWQNWWFWVLISLVPIGFVIFYFQKRNQIERQKKKLSQLNLSSLSNQFRPHFMLNALNSIGSQMTNLPHAEKVISRLGESINILYSFTQKNEFTHAFENEWKLVDNIIEIQRLLFIPELNVTIENLDLMPKKFKIPVGLLQIPVENSLLHGLRNKTDGNCRLTIRFEENSTHYLIHIADNGVGRERAAQINNFKKNGNGLKTILEMIAIINKIQKECVKFDICDHDNPVGTTVRISLNKSIDYGKIKL